ncbi:MAG: hypothetical protein Fues2KO_09770 [Fuerstiella sp.]
MLIRNYHHQMQFAEQIGCGIFPYMGNIPESSLQESPREFRWTLQRAAESAMFIRTVRLPYDSCLNTTLQRV